MACLRKEAAGVVDVGGVAIVRAPCKREEARSKNCGQCASGNQPCNSKRCPHSHKL